MTRLLPGEIHHAVRAAGHGPSRGTVRLHPSPYSLDSVLRILHTVLLAGQGGMLMHASSVMLDGRAYLFTGVSESGKTTISRLAPPDAAAFHQTLIEAEER